MSLRGIVPATLIAAALLVSCGTPPTPPLRGPAPSTPTSAPARPTATTGEAERIRAVAAAAATPAGGAQRWGRVSRVVDGDTFVVGPDTFRVLGIDSCEANTPGGQEATRSAQELLLGPDKFIVITTEPGGPDRDGYGRLLRYVRVGSTNDSPSSRGADFGEHMVGAYHTGIYQGRNDASPAYLATLRGADEATGRDCGADPSPTATASPEPDDGETYVQYENDDDGESWFCSRRRWC